MKRSGTHTLKWFTGLVVLALAYSLTGNPASAAPAADPRLFATPEAAGEALLAALKDNNEVELTALFGAKFKDRLFAKDPAAARESRERLYQAARKGLTYRKDSADRVTLIIGPAHWPFPVPLVRSGNEWGFHTEKGLEEISNRVVGANERQTITVCRQYIAVQQQYAAKIRDGGEVRKFAQRLISTPGKQDGLYWNPAVAGGEESPFGPLLAEYPAGGRRPGDPYHGYYFRVLTRQGSRAPGGPYSFIINGNMIAGFALAAFPAEYGKTGIMTFLVSHHGKVLEKDLGPRTQRIAGQIKAYNPDGTWTEVRE